MTHDPARFPGRGGTARYRLVSHHLCPYVQRIAIALAERGVSFERITIDLADKPEWFRRLSPLGKVPLLEADGRVLFESAAILEYLEETLPRRLHPADPLTRAEHRAWMEFGSATLNAIAGLYNAPDAGSFAAKFEDIRAKFARIEQVLGDGPWFGGADFSLVDTVFGPVFRYFDVFEAEGLADPTAGLARVTAWRAALNGRSSVRGAVGADYAARLAAFLRNRNSHMSRLLMKTAAA